MLAIGVLLLAYVAAIEASRPHVDGDRLRLDGFVSLAEQNRIRNAEVLDEDGYVVGEYVTRNGSTRRYNLPYFKSEVLRENLANILVNNRIPSKVNQQFSKSLTGPITLLIPALILIVVFIYFILSWRQGTGLFGVSSGARLGTESQDVTFAEVAGQETAVAELREVSDFLSDTERFATLGAKIPRGILLYGPPGCGKTLIARALAGEAGAAFYSISGSDFVELYVGVGAARVRDLFKEARENAPSIIFIDELDSVGRRRTAGSGPAGAAGGSAEEQSQALNQLLAEIDGFSPSEGVIVVGATNRPDVIDPALLRPGRFDRAVGLELPDEQGRREILGVHARSKAVGEGVDLAAIATQAVGMTGADLASIVNEAALLAARERRTTISQPDLERALARIREAPERQRRLAIRDRRVGQGLLAEERVTFADVAGVPDAVRELAEVREYLGNPARFERMGARVPTGYLLTGPPGSGKTLLARAVAGETNAAVVSAAGTEFVEVFVGEGAARVRDLFAQARATAPAIIFIDELDAIGARRGALMSDHSERAQTLNQLLVELDGFGRRSGVIVMAATNRPDILDPALIRPGRFDRTIALDLPDLEARLEILELHAADKRLAESVDLAAIARLTRGLSPSDLANLVNEAALLAARRDLEGISQPLLEEALDRIGMGIAGTRALSDEDRRTVAYHEAGHGLVARALPGGRVLHKVSIVPRGNVLGVTWLPESDDRLVHSRSLLIERMATLLGGRVAEQLVFGEPGDGAANDLAQVGAIARRMVARLGMSEAVGAINYTDQVVANGNAPYSEETARLIDSESRKLVQEAEGLARDVLARSREALDRVAAALLERETLTLEEVEEIAGPLQVGITRPGPARRA